MTKNSPCDTLFKLIKGGAFFMKYTKNLLTREKRQTDDAKMYGGLFEILNNEKTIEEFIILSLKKLDKVNGNIHVVRKSSEIIEVLTDDENENKNKIMNSLVYKKVKETKKPFFFDENEEEDEFYAGFPLNLKGRFIGALIIEEKQEIKQWNEIFIVLHMLVFAFRYYSLVEKEREINIKDVVTGLYNEKYFYNHFEVEEEKFIRFKTDLTLVLVELKNLSEINDKYGYEVGEKVLKRVAEVVKAQSRIIDMPAKVDREIFAVLLSGTVKMGGTALMNRVKMMLSEPVEIDGKFIDIGIKTATSQFQNYHSKESFYAEVLEELKKQN